MSEMPNTTNGPDLSAIMRKVDQDIRDGKSIREAAADETANEVALHDPAPDPLEVHHERLISIVRNTSAEAMDRGRQARDALDKVLRTFTDRDIEMTTSIDKYIGEYRDAMEHFRIIATALATVDRVLSTHTVVVDPPAKPSKHNGRRGS